MSGIMISDGHALPDVARRHRPPASSHRSPGVARPPVERAAAGSHAAAGEARTRRSTDETFRDAKIFGAAETAFANDIRGVARFVEDIRRGAVRGDEQPGVARAVTDRATLASIADPWIDAAGPAYGAVGPVDRRLWTYGRARRQGLGRRMVHWFLWIADPWIDTHVRWQGRGGA